VRSASFIRAIMEAICTSETSLHLNMTIQRYIPVDTKLHTLQLETLKSLIGITFENSKKIHLHYKAELVNVKRK
jgi:hypothetical protein